MAILSHRDGRVRNAVNTPREAWFRGDLYWLFGGTRYHCVDGNVKLRSGTNIVTDIDAAVLDRTTGDLALFQLKWQDFHTSEVRELRSRSRNLTQELDEWAERVCAWLDSYSADALESALRLQGQPHGQVRRVMLFGLSKSVARVQGYGYACRHELLAVGTWAQVTRIRREVGPSAHALADIHQALKSEAHATLEVRPIPAEWTVAGRLIRFEDYWSSVQTSRVVDGMDSEESE